MAMTCPKCGASIRRRWDEPEKDAAEIHCSPEAFDSEEILVQFKNPTRDMLESVMECPGCHGGLIIVDMTPTPCTPSDTYPWLEFTEAPE